MALNRSSKFEVSDLFANSEQQTQDNNEKADDNTVKTINNKQKTDDNSLLPNDIMSDEIKTYKKTEEEKKPVKKKIYTKSRTYTIDDYTYYLMKATVKVLRDNDVRNEENGSLITESAFIRKAVRTEIERVTALNGQGFIDKVQKIMNDSNQENEVKY